MTEQRRTQTAKWAMDPGAERRAGDERDMGTGANAGDLDRT